MAPGVARVAVFVPLLVLASGCARTPSAPVAPRPAPRPPSARAISPVTAPATRTVAVPALPASQPDLLVIGVVGRQFDWSFEYPNGHVSKTLHIPAARQLELRLTSPDVLHALFIPELRLKHDAVPGRVTKVPFSASREGPFEVYCAELCGVRHGQHRTTGVVQSQQEFDRWLAGNAAE